MDNKKRQKTPKKIPVIIVTLHAVNKTGIVDIRET